MSLDVSKYPLLNIGLNISLQIQMQLVLSGTSAFFHKLVEPHSLFDGSTYLFLVKNNKSW